jgi:hypothetical protein
MMTAKLSNVRTNNILIRGVQIRSETDPNPIRSDSFGFRKQNIHFGSDRIDKVVS